MKFYANTVSELKEKVAAYKILFGATPDVHVDGYFINDRGEEFMCVYSHPIVSSIGNKYVTVNFDDGSQKIKPDSANSQFVIVGGI